MTVASLRNKLQEYIQFADDKKIKALYTLMESDISNEYNWWEDEEFLDDLDERSQRYKAGLDRGYTFEEAKAEILKISI